VPSPQCKVFSAAALAISVFALCATLAVAAFPTADDLVDVSQSVTSDLKINGDFNLSGIREGDWIVAYWSHTATYAGGEALAKRDAGRSWNVLYEGRPGSLDSVASLEKHHVPATAAQALWRDLKRAGH